MNDDIHSLAAPIGYRKVLVLVDTRLVASAEGAWHCLDRIGRLAVEQGAELTLCDVVESPPAELAVDPVAQTLTGLRRELARERLEAIAAPLRALVPLSVELCEGSTFLAITRLVLERRYDLVVHVTNSAARGGLAPTDMHLARKCPCALWVMDTSGPARYGNVLVAVDRELYTEPGTVSRFSLQLALTALLFARLDAAQVHLVHAWQPYAADLLAHPRAALGHSPVERYIASQRTLHSRWLATLEANVAGMHQGMTLHAQLVEGEASSVVAAAAERHRADLLVMGTLASGAAPGQFIGHTAERILGRVAIPVLTLKPPGFLSPVRAVPDDLAVTRIGAAQSQGVLS
ncbi:MAG: universal stress protein [Gammaproteobacteria bacterium]